MVGSNFLVHFWLQLCWGQNILTLKIVATGVVFQSLEIFKSRIRVIVYFGQSIQIYISVSAPNTFKIKYLSICFLRHILNITLSWSGKTRDTFWNWNHDLFSIYCLSFNNNVQPCILAFQKKPPLVNNENLWVEAQHQGCVNWYL